MFSSSSLSLVPLQQFSGHVDRVWQLAFRPSGSCIASCSGDHTIRLWTLEGSQWQLTQILDGVHTRTVRSVSWSPDGRYLASSGFDGLTAVWDSSNGSFECIATLEGHENEVKCVRWSPDGRLLATCSRDKTVWLWDSDVQSDFECCSVLSGHSQDVKFVTFAPANMDIQFLASCGYDNSIKLWSEEEDDYYCQSTLIGHESTVWCLAFQPQQGEFMVSVGDDNMILLWKREINATKPTYKIIQKLPNAHQRAIFYCDWSPNNLICTCGADDAIKLFKFDQTHEKLIPIGNVQSAHAGDVNCCSFHPTDPTLLASAGDDKVVKIWKIQEIMQ
jgi:WD40 repeat protein